MILTCPSCSARFLVPNAAIGSGRAVRCGKCAHQWFFTPRAVGPDIDKLMQEGTVEAPPVLKPIPPGSNLPVPKRRVRLPPVWAVAAAAMVLLAAAMNIALYKPAWLGLKDSGGLAFSSVSARRITSAAAEGTRFSENFARFTVEGKIVNTAGVERASPPVCVALLDKDGKELRRWWVTHNKPFIAAGEALPFVAPELNMPYAEGMKLRLDLGNRLELTLRKLL